MLEILILIALCRNIAAKARAKGRSGGGFGCLLVLLWVGGELCGGFARCDPFDRAEWRRRTGHGARLRRLSGRRGRRRAGGVRDRERGPSGPRARRVRRL